MGKGIFQVDEVGIANVLLRVNVVVSEGLTSDYGFLGVPGVAAGFMDVCVVVAGCMGWLLVLWMSVTSLYIVVCRVPSQIWIVISRKLMLV